jgi:hypothetical protein
MGTEKQKELFQMSGFGYKQATPTGFERGSVETFEEEKVAASHPVKTGC